VWDSREDDEHEVIVTNVLGLMRMTRLCIGALIESGDGHVVNIGSVAGIWAYANGSSYVASKFAVHGYTRALREDLFGKPVRVSNIAGGLVETEFSTVRFKGDSERAAAVYAGVGLGGPLQAEDIADCILFAVTRPPHVSIDEMLVLARAQTNGANVYRDS
jgi:NADP-dependent 3-hydroxy acid dehydrogenase YdfG